MIIVFESNKIIGIRAANFSLKKEDIYYCNLPNFKKIKKKSKEKYQIKEATLYAALNRLEKNGYILSYEGTETFGRPRTYYRLSTLGKQFLTEKSSEWKDTKDIINEFFKETDYE